MLGPDGIVIDAVVERHLHGLADEAFGAGDIEPRSHLAPPAAQLQAIEQNRNGGRRPEIAGLQGRAACRA